MITRIIQACRDMVSYVDRILFMLALIVTTPFGYISANLSMFYHYILLGKKSNSDNAEVTSKPQQKPLGFFLNRTMQPPILDRWRQLLLKELGFL